MSKMKTIKLQYWKGITDSKGTWKVLQVTDSIEYAPGEYLTKPQVDELCTLKTWKVTVVGPS